MIPVSSTDVIRDARRFMTVNSGRGQKIVLDFFQIGMADAAGFDANQQLARTDVGRRNLFDRYNAAALVNGGAHGRRNRDFKIGNRQ